METEKKQQVEDIQAMLTDPDRREEGFRVLMRKYGRPLYWHIRRIVVSHDDAEDVLQDTCVKILNNIDKFRGECQLKVWIYRIATNESLQMLRRHTHFFQSLDSVNEQLLDTLETETSMDSDAIEVLFQKALLTLPTQQRIAFNMRYYEDMSYEDIAQVTGKSVGCLKSNYHYASTKVKQFLKENS